jgi:hypothetical protein
LTTSKLSLYAAAEHVDDIRLIAKGFFLDAREHKLSKPAAALEIAARLLWKIEKAYSLGIPKNKLAHGVSQTKEEYAYARRYTMFWPNGRSFRT